MKVFVDCDIAVKLAQWGLLARFAQHLVKQGKAELYTVRTLPYRFKLSDKYKAAAMVGSMAAVDQLKAFVSQCKAPLAHDPIVAAALAVVPSVDAGEAALFAAAAHYDAALVDTGDKNALRAVGDLGSGHAAVRALAGKVACLEQTLLYLVQRWSFDVVSTAVNGFSGADAVARNCFAEIDKEAVCSALMEKVDDLAPRCSGLLSKEPFGWIR
jgi:hypothetical protein